MAIQIRQTLTITPSPTSLPRRIELRQALRSNRAQEEVTIDYALDPEHDVWFQDGAAAPAKSFRRTDMVSREDTVLVDRVSVLNGPGSGPMDVVEIRETITGGGGSTLAQTALLQLQR